MPRGTKPSAEQRRGRAGRIEPGACYRLWSESEQVRLQPHSEPEITSADLAPLVLELARWGIRDPNDLFWLDRPPQAHWQQAVELLQWLDAVDERGRISAHGRRILDLGLHPRLAHMVLAGREQGLGAMAAELAALLSDRDPLPAHSGADISLRLEALRNNRDRSGRLTQARKLARKLAGGSAPDSSDPSAAGGLLALAWPDRVGRARRGRRGKFLLSNGRGAFLPDDDPLAGADWLVACELDGRARESRIFLAAPTDQGTIEQVLARHIETSERAGWDEQRGTIVARRQRRLGALVLAQSELERPDASVIEAGLLHSIEHKGISALPWTDTARQWQARVQTLHELWPGDWPDVGDAALADSLADWLGPFLAGLRRWADVERLSLAEILNTMLDRQQQQALARLAPTHIEVPTGRRAHLDYTAEGGPILATRLQSVFGWRRTPHIADGSVPVALHLLSPAGRPLAITADLASFWQNAYPQVRKDMRGRYPKHPWPEDPVNARASDGVARRRVQ